MLALILPREVLIPNAIAEGDIMPDEEMPRDIGKLWGAIKSLEGTMETMRAWADGQVERLMLVLVGLDGGNGLKGDIRVLSARVEKTETEIVRLEAWGHKLWDVDRPAECIGAIAVEALEARLKAQELARAAERQLHERELDALQRARIAMIGAILASAMAAIGSVVVALITGR
jgi:hypothetical protein